MRSRAACAAALSIALLAVPARAAAQDGPWEAAIAEFEARDRVSAPPSGEIVFVGTWRRISPA
jgi:hypothetical protein